MIFIVHSRLRHDPALVRGQEASRRRTMPERRQSPSHRPLVILSLDDTPCRRVSRAEVAEIDVESVPDQLGRQGQVLLGYLFIAVATIE
jgi:hypothetical protein